MLHYQRGKQTACGRVIYADVRAVNPWYLVSLLGQGQDKKMCKQCVAEAKKHTSAKAEPSAHPGAGE